MPTADYDSTRQDPSAGPQCSVGGAMSRSGHGFGVGGWQGRRDGIWCLALKAV